jgi:hypothetical protein
LAGRAIAPKVIFLARPRTHIAGQLRPLAAGRFPAGWHDRDHLGRAESVEPCTRPATARKMASEFLILKNALAPGATGVVVVLPRKACNVWPVLSGSDITRLRARQARRWWAMA